MYIFEFRKEEFFNPEIGTYEAFSIEVFSKSDHRRLCYIPDVFVNSDKAQEFVDLCNRYQPEPVHMEELCIDFIQ